MSGIEDLFEPDNYTPGQSHLAFANETLSQLHPEPHGPEERQTNPLPHGLSHGLASDGNMTGSVGATTGMPGMRRQPVLPALLPKDGKEIHSIAEGTRHAPTALEQAQRREQVARYDRTTQELFQRQRQRVHNMALMQQHMAVLGGGARPAPIISSARSSLRLEHNGFDAAPTGGIGNGGRRSGVLADFSIHEDSAHEPLSGSGYPVFGRSNPGSQVPSCQPSVVDGRLSMPGSRVASRQPSIDRLDVALADIGSCFTSRAPSPDHHRATLSHTGFDAQDDRQTNHSGNDPADEPAGSREVPPKLNQDVSTHSDSHTSLRSPLTLIPLSSSSLSPLSCPTTTPLSIPPSASASTATPTTPPVPLSSPSSRCASTTPSAHASNTTAPSAACALVLTPSSSTSTPRLRHQSLNARSISICCTIRHQTCASIESIPARDWGMGIRCWYVVAANRANNHSQILNLRRKRTKC